MALTWVKIGNLKGPMGPAGNAAAVARFEALETSRVRNNLGQLPDGADLDTYNTVGQSGAYGMPSSGILNGPPITTAGVFEMHRASGSNYTCLQRVTTGESMWWREAFQLGSSRQWGEWREVATVEKSDASYVRNGRGQLPAGSDLDTFTSAPQAGAYGIPSSGIKNSPPIETAGIFEMYRTTGTNYSCVQRVTTSEVMWWREAFDFATNTPWGPWRRVLSDTSGPAEGGAVASNTIRRIVASADPYIDLNDGDLLIVLAEEP